MSYLKFDRNSMSNLEQSLDKEILRTNRMGAYYCSTLLGCNTRKYHGLLVVPVPELNKFGHVLLSSLDETVIQHGAEFNLALHKYQDGTMSPNGHKYIREYNFDTTPKTIYRVGGVILSKEMVFSSQDNRIMIKYTLIDAHSPTLLRFKPILAFRHVKDLTHANGAIDWSYQEEPNGISMCLYPSYPRLYLQCTKRPAWHYEPHWYMGFLYDKERERGHECVEDLPVPGYFECEIKKGESIIVSAGDSRIEPDAIATSFESSLGQRTPRTSFLNCLINAADQFYVRSDDDHSYLMAGYPWFGVRARDQFAVLATCTLGIGKPERYDRVMRTAWPVIEDFMEHGEVTQDTVIEDLDQPDVLLWLMLSLQEYSEVRGLDETREKYGSMLRRIVDYLMDGQHPKMKVQSNGLLYIRPQHGETLTWMNATINGTPVVDRQGYVVEFNALWYNALCFYRDLFTPSGMELDDLIERVGESFVRVFVNEHDYLFDYVADDRPRDWSVRPNMIYAVGLPYSPLSRKLQRAVLDIVTKELLTPKGLRSLSPQSHAYKGYSNGTNLERAYSSFQGGVWTWFIYAYLNAYYKLFRTSGLSFIDRVLIPFENEMALHGIGTISELYDGNPPFRSRGAISFAMSVAAVLKVRLKLDNYRETTTTVGESIYY